MPVLWEGAAEPKLAAGDSLARQPQLRASFAKGFGGRGAARDANDSLARQP